MASIAIPDVSAIQKERTFFFYMALAMLIATIAGFLRFLALGRSTFASPWWVHVHGVTMMGWLLLYVAQNGLVACGKIDVHRRLGILTAAWSLLVLLTGAMVLGYNTATQRVPPFFTSEYVIAIDGLAAAAFAALTWTGIAMRNRPDWHKRLMLSGTILIIAPGLGRLVPDFGLGTYITYYILPMHLAFFFVAVTYDLRTIRRVHPAYLWGMAGLVVMTVLPNFILDAPPMVALVGALKG